MGGVCGWGRLLDARGTPVTCPGVGAFRMGSAAGRLRIAAVRCSGAGLTRRILAGAGPMGAVPGAPGVAAGGAMGWLGEAMPGPSPSGPSDNLMYPERITPLLAPPFRALGAIPV
jgi:hypothetical protein